MEFHRYLNLPENPLKDPQAVIEKNKPTHQFDQYGVEDGSVLTDETLEAIKKTGLDIDFIIVFRTYGFPRGDIKNRLIHSDLTWKNGHWQPIPFGLNWEIGEDNKSVFQWWDMSAHSAHFPVQGDQLPETFQRLSGLHYVQRRLLGAHEGSVLLEEADLRRPTLVRTDVPHSVVYSGARRMAISVRFKQYLNWAQTLDVFQPLILEE